MIRVSDITLSGIEEMNVLEALRSGQLSWRGKFVGEFERAFAKRLGARHAVSCSSGTAALHLALRALGVGPGDEVIVPALTYVATANAVVYCGAKPVFVDVDPTSWCMDAVLAAKAVNTRTKAIVPVQLYGHWPDMDALLALGVPVIEDAAEGLGGSWRGRPAGTLGVMGCFSFYANKMLTTGEGGMVVTNVALYDQNLRHLRGQCQAGAHPYHHDAVGYNYRLTNLQAAVGLGQLEGLDAVLAKRQYVCAQYRWFVAAHRRQESPEFATAAPWMFATLVDPPIRPEVIKRLADAGVETRPVFRPLPSLPMYDAGVHAGSFPAASYIASRGLCLPTHANLSDDDLKRVVGCL